MARWVITGGCGFIGTSLTDRLLREGGHVVRVVDNLAVGQREDLGAAADVEEVALDDPGGWPSPGGSAERGRAQLVVGNILDEGLALRVVEGADYVVHLAANTGVEPSVKDPRYDCRANVLGTLNYLEAARAADIRRLVFASSGAAVGACEPPLHEELKPNPVSPYGVSKQAGELYCSAYAQTFGVETAALRFSNVYGPRSQHKNSIVAKFTRAAIAGEPWTVYGDGTQTRDYIYVEDLTNAIVLAANVPDAAGEVFQIATCRETTVSELMRALRAALSEQGIGEAPVENDAPRQGDVARNYADISKAERILGWKPEVSLEDGLRRTVRWFLERQG